MRKLPRPVRSLAAVVIGLSLFLPGHAVADTARRVVGWVERVQIFPGGLELNAKIDTGARSSSLNAAGMTRVRRDGAEWIVFEVTNRLGKTYRFQEKLVRIARIRRHRGQTQSRPVVRLGICLGDVYRKVEVNLIDRTGFNYQMLIGRRFLRRHFVVNPSETFTVGPNCKEAAAR